MWLSHYICPNQTLYDKFSWTISHVSRWQLERNFHPELSTLPSNTTTIDLMWHLDEWTSTTDQHKNSLLIYSPSLYLMRRSLLFVTCSVDGVTVNRTLTSWLFYTIFPTTLRRLFFRLNLERLVIFPSKQISSFTLYFILSSNCDGYFVTMECENTRCQDYPVHMTPVLYDVSYTSQNYSF